MTGPYKETDPFHEPLITFAYLAGITKKLEMATGVIILPQRQTVLFAKQAADSKKSNNGLPAVKNIEITKVTIATSPAGT